MTCTNNGELREFLKCVIGSAREDFRVVANKIFRMDTGNSRAEAGVGGFA